MAFHRNILTKTKVYDDTIIFSESTTFTYGNSVWPDELTSVNGTSLTYDANGNVLTYGNIRVDERKSAQRDHCDSE